MNRIEPKRLYDTSDEAAETDEDVLRKFQENELGENRCRKLKVIIPKRLVNILFLQGIFMMSYYYFNCKKLDDGSWVSEDAYLPSDIRYDPLRFMFGVRP